MGGWEAIVVHVVSGSRLATGPREAGRD